MLSLNMAPNEASFRARLAREACFLVRNGGFPGFLFTGEYTGSVDQAVYIVTLALTDSPQEAAYLG
jgi:hypothetical protein